MLLAGAQHVARRRRSPCSYQSRPARGRRKIKISAKVILLATAASLALIFKGADVARGRALLRSQVASRVVVNPVIAVSPSAPLENERMQSNENVDVRPAAAAKSIFVKSFVDLSIPWTDWSPCDPSVAFERRCRPKATNCTEVHTSVSTHGIGNAIITGYQKHAKAIFNKGCAPKLVDDTAKYGLRFRLLDHVRVPDRTVNAADDNCVVYAITQPLESGGVAAVNRLRIQHEHGSSNAGGGGGTSWSVPIVGLHVRTGWADETSRRGAAWDALGPCEEYRGELHAADAPGSAVRDDRSSLVLENVVKETRAAADRAFGRGKWMAFVASDAPAVKAYAARVLSEGSDVGPAMYFDGLVGHNNDRHSHLMSREQSFDVGESSVADLVLLSEASMVVKLQSKFPDAASMRSMCPQRTLTVTGHPRHGLADVGRMLESSFKRKKVDADGEGAKWVPDLTKDETNKFEEWIPGGKNHPCFRSEYPTRACMCFVKLGHFSTEEDVK